MTSTSDRRVLPSMIHDLATFGSALFRKSGCSPIQSHSKRSAGTYSGDLLLNSNEVYTYHDWANSAAPDPASQVGDERDLFSLLLHESGNTLGLDDNMSDWTVMFGSTPFPRAS